MNIPSRLLPGRFRRALLPAAFCCGFLLLLAVPAGAALEYYMKAGLLPGEIAEGRFGGWTRLTGLSATVERPASSAPETESKAIIAVRLTKAPGAASSPLISRCAAGQITPRLVLLCMDGPRPLLRITLENVLISSYQCSGGSAPPEEEFMCRFRAIEWSYAEHDSVSGGNTATFNLETQAGGIKSRLPFRATLDPDSRTPGALRLTCPVEAGHRYRVVGNATLTGPWLTVHEFTAEADGVMDVSIPRGGPLLFLRVEEME